MTFAIAAVLIVLALGGAGFAFAGGDAERSKKRIASVAIPQDGRKLRSSAELGANRRKSVEATLKDIEKKKTEKKKRISLRTRLDQAGLSKTSTRAFWTTSGMLAAATGLMCLVSGLSLLATVLAVFAIGFGLPRWVLGFLKRRREKKFTNDFANAIDVIVRSVKSGLPTNDALKIVAEEFRDPVGGEFKRLVENMKLGVTLDQGLKRMFESMPTAEVNFFGIVMTVQLKSGGNLSEALGNLSAVLRDRKRLIGKVKAMSSEAKASAMIIGALPPGVMTIVYLSTPGYISLLFTQKAGNLMLAGCVIWMGLGIFVMKKMIDFKH